MGLGACEEGNGGGGRGVYNSAVIHTGVDDRATKICEACKMFSKGTLQNSKHGKLDSRHISDKDKCNCVQSVCLHSFSKSTGPTMRTHTWSLAPGTAVVVLTLCSSCVRMVEGEGVRVGRV